jgi:hypothetical protein
VRDFSAEDYSGVLSWREKPERAPAVETIRKGGIVHGAGLLQFLLISNQLSSDPVEIAELASHSDAGGQHRGLHERPHGEPAGRRPPHAVFGLCVGAGVTVHEAIGVSQPAIALTRLKLKAPMRWGSCPL